MQSVTRRGAAFVAWVLVAGVVLTGGVAAQPHNQDVISVDKAGRVWRTTVGGTATTLFQFPGIANCVRMAADNNDLIVTNSVSSATVPHGIYRLDPSNSSLTTLMALPAVTPFEVIQDQDGDLIFTGVSQATYGLWRHTIGSTQIQKVIDLRGLGLTTAPLDGGLIRNLVTGNFLFTGGAFATRASSYLWDVSPNGVVTTIGPTVFVRYSIAQDHRTGDIYGSGWQDIHKINYATGQATTLITGPGDFYAIALDRASPRTQDDVRPRDQRSLHGRCGRRHVHDDADQPQRQPDVRGDSLSESEHRDAARTARGLADSSELPGGSQRRVCDRAERVRLSAGHPDPPGVGASTSRLTR